MIQKILCYSIGGTSQIEIDSTDIDKYFTTDQGGGFPHDGDHFTKIGDWFEIEIWTPLIPGCLFQAYGVMMLEPGGMSTLEFVIMDQVGRLNMLKDLVPLVMKARVSESIFEIRQAIGDPGEYKDVKPLVATMASLRDHLSCMIP